MKRKYGIIAISSCIILIIGIILILVLLQNSDPKDETKKEKDTMEIQEYREITADKAKEMMDNQDVVILDVRTEAEYRAKHIKDAVLIPLDQVEDLAEIELPEKEKTILVYCRSGQRSRVASQMLVELGYTNVYEFGGIIDWPYETE